MKCLFLLGFHYFGISIVWKQVDPSSYTHEANKYTSVLASYLNHKGLSISNEHFGNHYSLDLRHSELLDCSIEERERERELGEDRCIDLVCTRVGTNDC